MRDPQPLPAFRGRERGAPVPDCSGRARNPVRVVLCVAESSLGAGLKSLLRNEPEIALVGVDEDCERVVDLVDGAEPEVVVIDLASVGAAAVGMSRRVRERGPHPHGSVRVLLLVDDAHCATMFAAIRVGVRGVVQRDGPVGDIVEAIRILSRGGGFVATGLSRHVLDHLAMSEPPAPEPRRLEELTDRQRAVLSLVADGLSNPEIAVELSVTERTVKYHVSNILCALGVRTRLQAVKSAYGPGYAGRGAVPEYRVKTGPRAMSGSGVRD